MEAALAMHFGTFIADHLGYANEVRIMAVTKSGTIAVLLSCTLYFKSDKRVPYLRAPALLAVTKIVLPTGPVYEIGSSAILEWSQHRCYRSKRQPQ